MPLFSPFPASALSALLPEAAAQNPAIITDNLPGCNFVTGQMEAACIPVFVGHVIQTVFGLISIFFLINVMYAGYLMAIGSFSGDRAKGVDRLKWSVLGLVISVCAYLILNLIVTVISP